VTYNLQSVRILVIDDNMPIRMLIRMLLLDLGIGHVDVASDGEDGLDKYRLNKPDMILVDWRMDKMDGIAFTKTLRADSSSHAQHVPILMMTGFTNKERVFTARDAGVTEFLIKPFTVDSLAKHLSHVIDNPRDFIKTSAFAGPDRRRKRDPVPSEKKKRKADKLVTANNEPDIPRNANFVDLRGGVFNSTVKSSTDKE
jgi:CheY-like chemotaxis protein